MLLVREGWLRVVQHLSREDDGGRKIVGEREFTHMRPWLQVRAIDRILVEARPLLERLLRVGLMLVVCPFEHLRLEWKADTRAIRTNNTLGVVEQIIGIDDTDLHALRPTGGRRAVRVAVPSVRVVGANLPDGAEVFEDTPGFVVAGFGGVEVVEAGEVVKGGDRAPEVRGDAGMRVADEEGEVEFGEKGRGDDGGVVGFGEGVEWVRGLGFVVFLAADVGLAVGFFVPVG